MANIPLQLRSFKLHLILPKNLRNRLAKTFTLIYVPRTSATLSEINGAKFPPKKPAPIILRRDRLVEAESDTEVVYASTDQVFTSDGMRFEEDDDEEMVESNYLKHEHGIDDGNEVGNKVTILCCNIQFSFVIQFNLIIFLSEFRLQAE
ncbi:hypothetical protein IEQ34_011808 [Dendrobium chrysotoxum]|uniref:Uncharacterized protein n=1 Tax=Dendrobium chrysotoxum TaxID=161865 RepID=A0AAV7GTB3_DENCH|nr:hypothetical protein IEQ34_011808 [Dendrobium chrysotoxum]